MQAIAAPGGMPTPHGDCMVTAAIAGGNCVLFELMCIVWACIMWVVTWVVAKNVEWEVRAQGADVYRSCG